MANINRESINIRRDKLTLKEIFYLLRAITQSNINTINLDIILFVFYIIIRTRTTTIFVKLQKHFQTLNEVRF